MTFVGETQNSSIMQTEQSSSRNNQVIGVKRRQKSDRHYSREQSLDKELKKNLNLSVQPETAHPFATDFIQITGNVSQNVARIPEIKFKSYLHNLENKLKND